ncbi:MAG: M24 family metallopeptidase [Chloroflexi bacterium]|nr:M24 family metallopeptidase [Chloroflexota bacterium]
MGPDRFRERLARARDAAEAAGVQALLLGVGPELEWLTGYQAKPLERLTLLVVAADADPAIVVPRLEVAAAEAAPAIGAGHVRVVPWQETDDPMDAVWELLRAEPGARLAVSDTLRASFVLGLQGTFPGAAFELAGGVVGMLRRVKDADEVALLRLAAHAADRAVLGLAAGRLVGRTEADIAAEVRTRLVDEGHDSASFWIVASGPRSASPHHEPDDRVVRAGEPLLLDIGGRRAGYSSDITRTLWITGGDDALGPDATFRTIHELVRAANAAGRDAVRPGVAAQDVDRAARDVIEAAGHGPDFFHRLGHGIGLEGHEDPYLVAGNEAPLLVGDAFSIEPGVYLEGRYGVRIEDIVVCAEDGADVLNEATRELLVVSGV